MKQTAKIFEVFLKDELIGYEVVVKQYWKFIRVWSYTSRLYPPDDFGLRLARNSKESYIKAFEIHYGRKYKKEII